MKKNARVNSNLISLDELLGFKIAGRGGIRVRESKLEAFLKNREREKGLFGFFKNQVFPYCFIKCLIVLHI